MCSYEGRGGLCSIRLSQPLLKLRPRRDLVETLLVSIIIFTIYIERAAGKYNFYMCVLFCLQHEMIHAFLFITENNRVRGRKGEKEGGSEGRGEGGSKGGREGGVGRKGGREEGEREGGKGRKREK